MNYSRIDRISEQARRDLDQIIRDELNDPRITGTFSITRVDVTRDLSFAKVYVSVLEEENRKPLMAALKHASGYLRHALGKKMIIRYSPELTFVEDHNIEYGLHISNVLKNVLTDSDENDTSEGQ